jgi:hypothetical protein
MCEQLMAGTTPTTLAQQFGISRRQMRRPERSRALTSKPPAAAIREKSLAARTDGVRAHM